MANIYTVTLEDGQTFLMRANLADATAPIEASFDGRDEDAFQGTPFQTADARHYATKAAELCAVYFRADADDCVTVKAVR